MTKLCNFRWADARTNTSKAANIGIHMDVCWKVTRTWLHSIQTLLRVRSLHVTLTKGPTQAENKFCNLVRTQNKHYPCFGFHFPPPFCLLPSIGLIFPTSFWNCQQKVVRCCVNLYNLILLVGSGLIEVIAISLVQVQHYSFVCLLSFHCQMTFLFVCSRGPNTQLTHQGDNPIKKTRKVYKIVVA
jgi:hypothetical protein